MDMDRIAKSAILDALRHIPSLHPTSRLKHFAVILVSVKLVVHQSRQSTIGMDIEQPRSCLTREELCPSFTLISFSGTA